LSHGHQVTATPQVQAATPKPRFVIMAASRSGSNMLCTMLDSHPAILCHHELYNPKGVRLALALRGTDFTLGTVAQRDSDPEAFFEHIWQARPGFDCVGFKFTHRQNETIYRRLLDDRDLARIVLRRRNRVKTFASQKLSEALSEWEVYSHRELTRERPKIVIDPDALLERVAFDDAYYAEVRAAMGAGGHDWIEVCYEDLFEPDVQRRVTAFLGVQPPAGGLKVGSVKQNSSDLRDLIANFDELRRHFAGTAFEAELLDTGN
jgi:hypothetical protein